MLANLADAVLTHFFIATGQVEELNPLMSYLIELNIFLFYAVKISLVFLAVILLLRVSSQSLARKALFFGCFIYTVILSLHLYGMLFNEVI